MRGRACWAMGAVMILLNCAGIVLPPSSTHHVPMCSITCARDGRLMFRAQHLCTGARFFEDFSAIGRHTERNEDGTINLDSWIASDGREHAVIDVEMKSCSDVIHDLIQSRASEQRGQFPGETPDGHSLNPPRL